MDSNGDESEEGSEQVAQVERTEEGTRVETVKSAPRVKGKPLTHFLCLVLAGDTKLTTDLTKVQNAIFERHNLPEKVRVNVVNDLHVTIALLSLESKEDESRVLEAVESSKPLEMPESIDVSISGVGRFGVGVLWARPVFPDETQFKTLVLWRKELHRQLTGLTMHEKRPFVPHATIAKTLKLGRLAKSVHLNQDVVETANSIVPDPFQPQPISSMALFSCRKDGEGRYIRRGSVKFN